MSVIGLRVVRGQGWKSGCEDGGEGGVGTVISEASTDATASVTEKLGACSLAGDGDKHEYQDGEKRCVTVFWDCTGLKGTYSVGSPLENGPTELRVLDNSCLGVKHPVGCNGPNCFDRTEIKGIRWQCTKCDENFCVYCFLQIEQHHDRNHCRFYFYEHPKSGKQPVLLSDSSGMIPVKGIFVEAEDKSELDLKIWIENGRLISRRNKINLIVVEPKVIGCFQAVALPEFTYRSLNYHHFSSASFSDDQYPKEQATAMLYLSNLPAHITGHDLRDMLRKYGVIDIDEWVGGGRSRVFRFPRTMMETRKQCEEIISILKGNLLPGSSQPFIVRFVDGGNNREIITADPSGPPMPPPSSVSFLTPDSLAESIRNVKIQDDEDELRVRSRVRQLKTTVVYEEVEASGTSELTMPSERVQQVLPASIVPNKKSRYELNSNFSARLVRAAADGNLNLVKEIVQHYKTPLDAYIEGGINSLHMACQNGHLEIVQWLFNEDVDAEKEDKLGRRALHFTVEGCKPEVLQFLISQKVEINSVTKEKKWSALHIAADKQCLDCVKLLVESQCDVNLQDCTGATALHNVVIQTRLTNNVKVKDIIFALNSSGRVDWMLQDKDGNSVLHSAVFFGDFWVIEFILEKGGSHLATQRIPGSNMIALHCACLYKNLQMAEFLIHHLKKLELEIHAESIQKESLVDLKTENNVTSLLISCSRNDYSLVEKLVNAGADVNAVDNDGNTVIINATQETRNSNEQKPVEPPSSTTSPDIFKLYEKYLSGTDSLMRKYPCLAMVCYLIQKTCSNFKASNRDGETAINLLTDDSSMQTKITRFLEDFTAVCFGSINTATVDLLTQPMIDAGASPTQILIQQAHNDMDSSIHPSLSHAPHAAFDVPTAGSFCYNCKDLMTTSSFPVNLAENQQTVRLCCRCFETLQILLAPNQSSDPESVMDVTEPSTLLNQGAASTTSQCPSNNTNPEDAGLPMDLCELESSGDSLTSGISSGHSTTWSARSSSAECLRVSTVTPNRIRTGLADTNKPTRWEINQETVKGVQKDVLTDGQGGKFTKSNKGQWKCTKQGAQASRKCPATVLEDNGKFTLLKNHVHFRKKHPDSSNNSVNGDQA